MATSVSMVKDVIMKMVKCQVSKKKKNKEQQVKIQYKHGVLKNFRLKKRVRIEREITELIIPSTVKESHIKDLYEYMDIAAFLQFDTQTKDDKAMVVNFDFHSLKNNEVLYAVIVPCGVDVSKHYSFFMKTQLYTKDEIENIFQITELPKTYRSCSLFQEQLQRGQGVLELIKEQQNFSKQILCTTSWGKIPVINLKQTKSRVTLSVTKEQLIGKLQYNPSHVLPILVLVEEGFRIEYLLLAKLWEQTLQKHVHLGIALRYHSVTTQFVVSGVYIDKDTILRQHQLVDPTHNCHCLEHFCNTIDDLKVGNPDDWTNKMNNKLKEIENLKKKLKQQDDKLREIKDLQQIIDEKSLAIKGSRQVINDKTIEINNLQQTVDRQRKMLLQYSLFGNQGQNNVTNHQCLTINPINQRQNDYNNNQYLAMNIIDPRQNNYNNNQYLAMNPINPMHPGQNNANSNQCLAANPMTPINHTGAQYTGAQYTGAQYTEAQYPGMQDGLETIVDEAIQEVKLGN